MYLQEKQSKMPWDNDYKLIIRTGFIIYATKTFQEKKKAQVKTLYSIMRQSQKRKEAKKLC